MSQNIATTKTTKTTKTIKLQYILGYLVSLVLTIMMFIIAGKQLFVHEGLFLTIMGLAIIQLFVQLKYFLHLSLKPDARWHLITFIFTMIILLAIVIGSIWIMFNLSR